MITASAITPAAQRWLAATTAARVLSVHERACNLINQNDELLALVNSARGLNPFALAVEMPFNTLSLSDKIEVSEGRLVIGQWVIDTYRAVLWQPAPNWDALRAAQPDWAALFPLALELAPEGSLLDLTPAFGSPSPDAEIRVRRGGRGVRSGASLLIHGLTDHSLLTALDGVHQLAGLGSGLTPAGDDFIVGVLLAVWAGLFGAEAWDLCAPIAEAAAERTTFLSAAYLRAAARGECMMQWHTLFEAALDGTVEQRRLATGELVRVGHTSGADALAGFLAFQCFGERTYNR